MTFNPDNYRSSFFPETFTDVRRDERTGALYAVIIDTQTKEIVGDTRKYNFNESPFSNNNERNNNEI